jgi:very-short-patch-repair endonuclease
MKMKKGDNMLSRFQKRRSKYLAAHSLRQRMTPAEAVLWQRLRANQLSGLHFRRQHVLFGFIVDFYCHETRLIVEIDGEVHSLQKEFDLQREAILSGRGLRMIRFTNQQVHQDIESIIQEITKECESRIGLAQDFAFQFPPSHTACPKAGRPGGKGVGG